MSTEQTDAKRSYLFSIVLPILALGITADQASKSWASLRAAEPRLLVPGYVVAFSVPNPGAMLGIGKDQAGTCLALIAISLAAGGILARLPSTDRLPWRGAEFVAVAVVLAGIAGNTIDRVFFGYVRDFLVTWITPSLAFNIADVFVVAGGVSLLIGRCVATLEARSRLQMLH